MNFFKNTDPVVLKETKYIAIWVLILGAVMQAVFLILGKWDYTVLLGGIFGYIIAVGNFYFMGLSVQNAVTKTEDDAKDIMKTSQKLRFLLIVVLLIIGCVLPIFNKITLLVTLLFPRIAINFKMFFKHD